MSQSDSINPVDETHAEAALQLLRSLATAGENPEKFAQACLDWSRLSDDAMAVPDFMSILSMLSGDQNGATRTSQPDYDPTELFSLSADGTVLSISRDLSDHLGLIAGQSLSHEMDPPLNARDQSPKGQLISLPDSFGISRHISLYPIAAEGRVTGYMARAALTRLSPSVRAHLGTHHSLTKSELDILELVMRRYTLEHVARLRGITLNTVRTHVARLIQKLACHSLVEAVSTTLEISNTLTADSPVVQPSQPQEVLSEAARIVALETPGQNIEYRRYGSPLGRPVLILHSLEYGFAPSDEMIQTANALGLNLVFPMRPGFGASTATTSLAQASENLKEFIRVLGLKEVTLVGLSLAAPLALATQDKNTRIRQTMLINYGLNVGDKLKHIQPRWSGGMLRMTLNSSASFMFGIRTMASMIRTFGGLRFYRMLYRNQSADLEYLEDHPDLFQAAGDYIATADRTNVSIDLETAFLPNQEIEPMIDRARALQVISSNDQHGVSPDETKADADRIGVRFKTVPFAGRNWMFQHPRALFDAMMIQKTQS